MRGHPERRDSGVDLLAACAASGGRLQGGYAYPAELTSPRGAGAVPLAAGGGLGEHLHGGHVAKAVIGVLTITGGPTDCHDGLLQSTEDVAVAADCGRAKEDLRSLCRAAHGFQDRHGDDASLVGFLEQTRVEPPMR